MIPILLKLYDVSCEGNQLTLPFDMLMGHNYLISNKYQLLIETSLPPQNVSAVIECCADTIKWKQSPTLHNPVVWYINSQIIASNTLTRPMPNVYEAVLNQTHPIYGFCLTTTVKPESVWLWLDNNLIVKFENLVELLPNSYFLPLTINKQRIQDYQLDSAPISLSQAKIAKIRLVYAHTNHQTPDIHLATLTYRYSYINSIGTDSGYNKLPLGTIGASETVVAVGALSPLPLSLPMIPISIGSNALSTIGSSKTAIGSRSLRSSKYPITENTVVGMRSYSTWR